MCEELSEEGYSDKHSILKNLLDWVGDENVGVGSRVIVKYHRHRYNKG